MKDTNFISTSLLARLACSLFAGTTIDPAEMDTGSVRSLEVIVADFMRFTPHRVKRAIRRMVKMPE
jgi:hypothetical protein